MQPHVQRQIEGEIMAHIDDIVKERERAARALVGVDGTIGEGWLPLFGGGRDEFWFALNGPIIKKRWLDGWWELVIEGNRSTWQHLDQALRHASRVMDRDMPKWRVIVRLKRAGLDADEVKTVLGMK